MRRLLLLAVLVVFATGCTTERGSSVHIYMPANHVPYWIKAEHLPKKAIAGARLFETAGCTACHTYAGTGTRNLGAPSLTAIGRRHLGIRFQIAHLKCPSCVNPGSPMPPFRSLGMSRLRQLAIFLEASKGTH
jgi:mono/diheme cytochrome c family protein